MIYFPTNWGAKEPHNPPNHRVDEERSFFGEHFLRKKLEKAMKHCFKWFCCYIIPIDPMGPLYLPY